MIINVSKQGLMQGLIKIKKAVNDQCKFYFEGLWKSFSKGVNMYETNNFRKGLKVLIDNEPYVVIDFQHSKQARGSQFTRTKLKNLITGANLERTFKSGEKFGVPDIVSKLATFLYKDEAGFHFMDKENYEQYDLTEDDVFDVQFYLTDNLDVHLLFFNEKVIGIDVPNQVTLKVVQTEPGIKGNTVSGGSKSATLETGLLVNVPLHINVSDVLKINTKTGHYLERA